MEWKRRDNSRRGEVTHQAAHPESWIQAVCLPQKKENLEHKQNVLNKQIIKRNEKINDETGIHTTSLLHIAIILQHKQIPNDKKEKILYENSNYVQSKYLVTNVICTGVKVANKSNAPFHRHCDWAYTSFFSS